MNKVIDKDFRSCRFVSTIVKHPVFIWGAFHNSGIQYWAKSSLRKDTLCFTPKRCQLEFHV